MDKPISRLRREYSSVGFSEELADPDPIRQFDRWFDDAVRDNVLEPNAMTIATVNADGQPSARVMLLKGYDPQGFIFYTNYLSRKGRELTTNPHAALCFWWAELERQVRVEGVVERISEAESDAYFQSRPRESQIAAWASSQSQVLPDRAALLRQFDELNARYPDTPPRPPNWGGYRLTPTALEFWQGREFRMHDRLRYTRTGPLWKLERLSP